MMSAYKNLTATQKNSFKIALRCLHQNSIEINLDNVSKAVQEKETIVRFIPVDG